MSKESHDYTVIKPGATATLHVHSKGGINVTINEVIITANGVEYRVVWVDKGSYYSQRVYGNELIQTNRTATSTIGFNR